MSIGEFDHPHILLHVDAVHDRSRYPLSIGADRMGRTFAAAGARIASVAGVHRSNQHEVGGIAVGLVDAADSEPSLLQWKAERFEGLPTEFGQFVEEEDSLVGKRDLPRFGVGSTTDEGLGGHVVVRCAEWAGVFQLVSVQLICDAIDGGDFEYLIVIHGWEDGGQQLRHQ